MISDAVRNQFIKFSERFEGRVHWMYVDVKGFITTGVGNLIDPIQAALTLPWRVDGQTASTNTVATAWRALKADKEKLGKLGHKACKNMNNLRLSDEDIDKLVLKKLDSNVRTFETYFPKLSAWPDDAQLGAMSMCWALGPHFIQHWPRLGRALRDQDWAMAAEECKIDERGNPGVILRNATNKNLFLSASHQGPDDDTVA